MSSSRRAVLSWLLCAAGSATWAGRAAASLARPLELEPLCAMSRVALVGRALAAKSRWETIGEQRRIITTTRVHVEDVIAGSDLGSEILVRTLGGRVGDVGQIVHGEAFLLLGERAVLLLMEASGGALHVSAMAQGHYPVRNDPSRVPRLARSPRLPELVGRTGQSAVERLHRQPLDEGRRRIAEAWKHARR